MQPWTCVAPGFDGGHSVGDGHIGIVMRVNAEDAIEALANVGDDLGETARDGAAVGVAQAEHIGARLLRGFERPQREIGIGVVAVEEMLGVVDHFLAVILQKANRLGNERQIFFFGDAERALHVQIPALPEDRNRPAFPLR